MLRSGRAGGGGRRAAGCVCLRTRPPSPAPQEAAPVKGLRCAAPRRSAPRLPLRRARFPPGAGLSFGGSGPARQGWSQRRTGHHCCLKPCWKAAEGECPGHLRLVRPAAAAAGALCVLTPPPRALLRALSLQPRCLLARALPPRVPLCFWGLAGFALLLLAAVPPPPEPWLRCRSQNARKLAVALKKADSWL